MSRTENRIDNSRDLILFCKTQDINKLDKLPYNNDWINERDIFGWGALHYASFFGNLDICQDLIGKRYCDINLFTSRGNETALFLAAANNHYHVVDYLIKHGADTQISDFTGKIPLDVSYNESFNILLAEKAKYNRITRSIPTFKKIVTNKIFQSMAQLLLYIILELYKDKIINACYYVLELGPHINFLLLNIFVPVKSVLNFLKITDFYEFLTLTFNITLFHWSWPIWNFVINVIQSMKIFSVLYDPLISIFQYTLIYFYNFAVTVIGYLLSISWNLPVNIVRYLLSVSSNLLIKIISLTYYTISEYIINILSLFRDKILFLFYDWIQPKKLAEKLVYPIILLFSKVLCIFPVSIIQYIIRFYKRILGSNRHISNEEISVALLLVICIIIYMTSMIINYVSLTPILRHRI